MVNVFPVVAFRDGCVISHNNQSDLFIRKMEGRFAPGAA